MTDAYATPMYGEDVSVGDEGPTVTVESLERRDFVKYAGASGDFNPIHYDEPYATNAGNPSVFAQGMLVHGFVSHLVGDWLGLGNIRTFTVRFQSRAWPGDTVHATGVVTSVSREAAYAIVEADVQAATAEGDVLVAGSTTAHLPYRDD